MPDSKLEQGDGQSVERESPNGEPSFTRVARPMTSPTVPTYDDSAWNSGAAARGGLPFGVGWVMLGVGGGLGGWLLLRWRRQRNKPINRLRRQAKQAANELRDRVPSAEEAVRPAAGLTTALLSIAVILWQQAQARSRQADKVISRQAKKASKRGAHAASDLDMQKRLSTLKKRWNPSRLELEKISISRH
jgi:hypothetical protein